MTTRKSKVLFLKKAPNHCDEVQEAATQWRHLDHEACGQVRVRRVLLETLLEGLRTRQGLSDCFLEFPKP